MPRTKQRMVSFFLLVVVAVTVLVAEASSPARFASVPAFHSGIGSRRPSLVLSSLHHSRNNCNALAVRGGAGDDDDDDEESKDVKEDEEEAEEEDADDDEAVETGDDDDDDETEDEDTDEDSSSDEDDYYDDETEDEEEEEEESELASQLKKKSGKVSNGDTSEESSYVDPYFISPSLQMCTTFGTILLSRKIDMFNPKIVRLIRALFVIYLVVQQAFIFYVRVTAKRNNDRTHVDVQNPLTSMLTSKLAQQQAGGANDMVKNLASSFLSKESTVVEYDMGQAKNMQGGILFNMLMMWFLHFKMQQVQPLLVTTINGFLQLFYNPLFQVYVLGRNLERPFKSPEVFKDPNAESSEEESSDAAATTTETTNEDADGGDETEPAAEEGESEDEDESSSDEEDSEEDDEDEDESE